MAVTLATALAPLNSTMIVVALPRMLEELGGDLAAGGWLFTAYLIAMAALQPLGGKLGDRFGRRGLVLGGLAGFGLASLAASLATSLPLLMVLRTLQAVTGAVVIPNGTALLREFVPIERRASAFGVVAAGIGIAAAAGPVLGGALASLAGWRALFAINLLLVLPALVLGWRSIPRRGQTAPGGRFDVPGLLLLPLLLVGLAGLLSDKAGLRLDPLYALPLAALGVLFVWWEWRNPAPLVQLHFFRRPAFAAANVAVAFGNLSLYLTMLAVPLLLVQGQVDNITAGLALAVLAVAMTLTAPVGGRLADRCGRRVPVIVGHALLALVLLPLALAASQLALPSLLACLATAGVGIGLTQASLQSAAVEAVAQAEAGAAAGVFSTSRYLGSIIGSSLLAPLLAGDGGFGAVFGLCAGAALLATLASPGLPAKR